MVSERIFGVGLGSQPASAGPRHTSAAKWSAEGMAHRRDGHRRVRPRRVDRPTTAHVEAMVKAISTRYQLPVRILDGTGLRVSRFAALASGDIDLRASRLRVARAKKKGWNRRPALGSPLCRAQRRHSGSRAAGGPRSCRTPVSRLQRPGTTACDDEGGKHAGIPAYTPHDFRHRYMTLLVMAEVPPPIVRQVVGHSRASITLDVYSHVLLDEPPELLAERRNLVMERRARDAWGCLERGPLVALRV